MADAGAGGRMRELLEELGREQERVLRRLSSLEVDGKVAKSDELQLESIDLEDSSPARNGSAGAPRIAFEEHKPRRWSSVVPIDGLTEEDPSRRAPVRRNSLKSVDSSHGVSSQTTMGSIMRINTFGTDTGDPFKKMNENSNKSRVEIFVYHPCVELVFSVLIFTNTLAIASEAQYLGTQSGYESSVERGLPAWPGASEPASEVWPNATGLFYALDLIFGIIFTAELTLKLAAAGLKAVKEFWTWLDCAIIGFWLIEQASQGLLPVDPKIIRVARLARLLRFLKVVKTIQAFDSLYLMVQAIKSSFSALFWSSIVLLLTEMMLALVLNLLLEVYWTSETIDDDTRQLIYQYFGTFTKAFQTMIEMLLGNWYSITRLLTENVSEYYLIFGICHQLVLGFAVIEVITGVFLHQTFTVASMDDSIMMNEMKRIEKEQTKKINRFFEAADEDGSGTMDEHEFLELIDKQSTRDWLSAMGLPVHTFPNAFSMFDGPNGNGEITADKMAQAASRMKGQATAFELAIVRNLVEDIARAIKPILSPQPSPRQGA